METLETVALSRMSTMSRQMDIIANNIANVNTTGFKAARMYFSEYVQDAGEDSISYVYDYGTVRDYSTGALEFTNNPLDVALDSDGFFVVQTPDGQRYTRNGHFRLDEQRQLVATADNEVEETIERRLVTTDGYPVMSAEGDAVVIANAETMEISPDGVIKVSGAVVNRLNVVNFENPQALQQAEASLFKTDEVPVPAETSKIVQGALEVSNVQPIVELTQMIEIMRSFQASQKLIQDNDEAIRRAIQTIAGVTA